MSTAPVESRRERVAWRLGDIAGLVVVAYAVVATVLPMLAHTDTVGSHDWDQMEAHRFLAVKTIKQYHQFPFWDPYGCGGHTWWGGPESGTNVVSPWLPAYLLLPLTKALRVEVVGCAILGALGTYLFASRYTRSPALRAIAAIAFAISGRWALQIAQGHTWHLYYAWVPWALFFIDRAFFEKTVLRDLTLAGLAMAMMVYNGAIYPLPQCVVLIALYAVWVAVGERSFVPIGKAIAAGLIAGGLAAPRLLPLMETVRKYPRLVDSTETMDVGALFATLLARDQDVTSHPVAVAPWSWHEYGAYIGVVPVLLMVVAVVAARTHRERGLRAAGALALVLSLGRFHDLSPWGILHDHVPLFESQHVPSRWSYPAILVLVVGAGAVAERFLRDRPRRWLLELALLVVAAFVATDVVSGTKLPMSHVFSNPLPNVTAASDFHQETKVPPELMYPGADWTPAALPGMLANVGTLECATSPGLSWYYRGRDGRTPGLGAWGVGDPHYTGEVGFSGGAGKATITGWSPNVVTVAWEGAQAGDVIVLNENYDPGWHAGSDRALDAQSRVAARVDAPSGTVTFRYRPRLFILGMLVFLMTIVSLIVIRFRFFRRRAITAPAAVASA